MHNKSVNNGVQCAVNSCKYNEHGQLCKLQKIMVSSDINDKHYCKSFEQSSDKNFEF